MKEFGERILVSLNNCIVIEFDVFLRDGVPTINHHKQAVAEVKQYGVHTPCLQMSHHTM